MFADISIRRNCQTTMDVRKSNILAGTLINVSLRFKYKKDYRMDKLLPSPSAQLGLLFAIRVISLIPEPFSPLFPRFFHFSFDKLVSLPNFF